MVKIFKRYWVLAYDLYYPRPDNVLETFMRQEDAEAFAAGLRVPDPWELGEWPTFETESELTWYEEGLRHTRYDEVEVRDMGYRIFEDSEVL